MEISKEELLRKMVAQEQFILLDVSSRNSYLVSHLRGAVLVENPDDIATYARRFAPDLETCIVVYAEDSDRLSCVQPAERLRRFGYNNVREYWGGKREWFGSGYPLVA